MTCQVVCPENVIVKKWQAEPVVFDEEETRLILEGKGLDSLGSEVKAKLTQIGLVDSWDILPRNLGAFLS